MPYQLIFTMGCAVARADIQAIEICRPVQYPITQIL